MAKEKNTILHRWFEEVWNKGKAELIDVLIAPECIAHGPNAPHATRSAIPSAGRKNSPNSFLAVAAPSRISTSPCTQLARLFLPQAVLAFLAQRPTQELSKAVDRLSDELWAGIPVPLMAAGGTDSQAFNNFVYPFIDGITHETNLRT